MKVKKLHWLHFSKENSFCILQLRCLLEVQHWRLQRQHGSGPRHRRKTSAEKKEGLCFPAFKGYLGESKKSWFLRIKAAICFSFMFDSACWWLWGWNVGKAPATIASEMLRPKKTKEDAVDSVISLHLHMLRNEVNVVQAKRFMHGHYRATWIWNTNLLEDNQYGGGLASSFTIYDFHSFSLGILLAGAQGLERLWGTVSAFYIILCRSAPSAQAQTQILRELFFHIPDVMFQVTGLQYAFSGSFFSDVNEAQTHAMITIDRFHEFDTFGKGVEDIWQWDTRNQTKMTDDSGCPVLWQAVKMCQGLFETEIKTHHTPVLQRQNIWKFVKIKK